MFCASEAQKNDFREVMKCLIKNDAQLTTECKQELQRFVQATRQTTPPGGGPLGSLGGMFGPGSQVPSVNYDGRNIGGLNENNLTLSTPFYRNQTDAYSASITGGVVRLDSPVSLDSNQLIPNDLYRAELGLQFSRRLEGQRAFGLRGTVGYAGDTFKPDTQNFSVTAHYSLPGKEGGYWIWMLILANNSPLGTYVPVPGFIYVQKTPTFTGLYGLPILSLQWTPINPWAFSLSAFGPQVKTEVSYGAVDSLQFFTGLSWKQQRFLLSGRANDKERLSLDEKFFEVGLRKPLLANVFSELQGGYAFDRSLYLGEGIFKKDGGTAALDSGWYLKWSLKAGF